MSIPPLDAQGPIQTVPEVVSKAPAREKEKPSPAVEAQNHSEIQHSSNAASVELQVLVKTDGHGGIYYQFVNGQTGEIIREIPPEQLRKLGANIAEFLRQRLQHSVDVKS